MSTSGVEMAEGVRRGVVDAHEVTRQAVVAANADRTNAFTTVETDPVARTTTGPMYGVPIAVKDLIDHAGRVTTAGSEFYRRRADVTAPALANLENAGAVVIGRTGLHEFAFGFSSENPWFGPVLNPWDHSLSPGGSSGGSAAAVAAGIVPIALGTDTGGSVRVPAALCALAGLKVTHGLISTEGVFGLVPSLDTVGAIACSLSDLAMATPLMAGHQEPWPDEAAPIESIRMIVPSHWVEDAPLTSEVAAGFADFISRATALGVSVEHRALSSVGPSPKNADLIGPEVEAIHGSWRREGRPYGDDVAARIDTAMEVSEAEYQSALGWQRALRAEMLESTRDGALLVTPTVGAMDKVIGQDTIGPHHYRSVLSWFTAPVNVSGLPALTIPMPGDGRRPSVQLIGSPRSERRLLAAGRTLQSLGLLAHPVPVPTGDYGESSK